MYTYLSTQPADDTNHCGSLDCHWDIAALVRDTLNYGTCDRQEAHKENVIQCEREKTLALILSLCPHSVYQTMTVALEESYGQMMNIELRGKSSLFKTKFHTLFIERAASRVQEGAKASDRHRI